MQVEVTEQGVMIPKKLLNGATKVEIRSSGSIVLVVPVPDEDPIFSIGKTPVSDPEITDASVNHDKYIYGK